MEQTNVPSSEKVKWIPIESNPEVINKMMAHLGVHSVFGFNDVWGLDDELLSMVPQPTRALVFLYPLTDKIEGPRKRRAEESKGHISPNLWYMKQTIGNSCGTIAIIHSIANNRADVVAKDGYLDGFFKKTEDMTPENRAAVLESDETIAGAHMDHASDGQTAPPNPDDPINTHFVSFVVVDGDLYELDGRIGGPINHGPSTDLLKDAAHVIKKYSESYDGESNEFTVISLGPHPDLSG